MGDSKRAGRKAARSAGKAERLTLLDFAINAGLVFVVAPASFVGGYLVLTGTFGGTEQNQHLFLASVLGLIGVFAVLLGALRVAQHVKARRRFAELLSGDKKSAVAQNLDELTALARSLGPAYRKRLEGRLEEMGIRR